MFSIARARGRMPVSRSRALVALASAAVLAGGVAACGDDSDSGGGGGSGGLPSEVKLGMLDTMSGVAAFCGEQEKQGAELAVEEINDAEVPRRRREALDQGRGRQGHAGGRRRRVPDVHDRQGRRRRRSVPRHRRSGDRPDRRAVEDAERHHHGLRRRRDARVRVPRRHPAAGVRGQRHQGRQGRRRPEGRGHVRQRAAQHRAGLVGRRSEAGHRGGGARPRRARGRGGHQLRLRQPGRARSSRPSPTRSASCSRARRTSPSSSSSARPASRARSGVSRACSTTSTSRAARRSRAR